MRTVELLPASPIPIVENALDSFNEMLPHGLGGLSFIPPLDPDTDRAMFCDHTRGNQRAGHISKLAAKIEAE